MTPEFAYFLKVNAAFIFLYAFYRLFFYKDTFFKLRRTILLAFFGLSFLYPLMNFQDWVKQQEPMVEVIQIYSAMLPETIITPEVVPQTDWHSLIVAGFSYLYLGGVAVLLLRFFAQLGSILLLARKSRRVIMHGVPVCRLNKPVGPFSFFQLIFLHPESHSEKEIDEILTHECTHVFQWHSIDVIVCELIGILCWINPFVWLLKREVRHNLEYLADNTVLESGYDSKSYQYHLLGLAHHNKSTAALYNSFNVLHLKNRISMMNKKRSRGIGRTKYLTFIPVAACLMLLSNIDALARITDELTENVVSEILPEGNIIKLTAKVVDYMQKPVVGANVIIQGTTIGTITDLDGRFVLEAPDDAVIELSGFDLQTRTLNAKDIKENMKIQLLSKPNGDDRVFTVVDKMPEFPGGTDALMSFLAKSVDYPMIAQENGIQGRVSCCFIINADGTIRDIEVIRGVDPSLDTEAVRVLKTMPKWTPGQQRGKNVAVRYTVPVSFHLSRVGEQDKAPEQAANKQTAKQKKQVAKGVDPSGTIFAVVEQMPQYPGGQDKLMTYLARSIKYPVIAQKNGIQGRVSCSFVIETDGSITGIEVLRGVDPSLDTEAVRVISEMPKWEPGIQKEMAVRVKYTVPVTFRLQ